jgi:hypothetical protein
VHDVGKQWFVTYRKEKDSRVFRLRNWMKNRGLKTAKDGGRRAKSTEKCKTATVLAESAGTAKAGFLQVPR